MDRLKGKVAVVTGAALGLGKATATRMAEEGAAVALLDILDEPGQALAQALAARGFRARYWRCDTSKEEEVKAAIDAAAAHFGRLDVLVNNAGVSGANKPTHELTEAEWDFVQAINVKGVFFGTKHAIAHLKQAGGGSIINLSSIYGLVGAGDVAPYHASKGAVRLMSKNDALTYAADRIRVNSVHPGFVDTPMTAPGHSNPEVARRRMEATPLGRFGTPYDIAAGCLYLASDDSSWVTGTELVIDGGMTAN